MPVDDQTAGLLSTLRALAVMALRSKHNVILSSKVVDTYVRLEIMVYCKVDFVSDAAAKAATGDRRWRHCEPDNNRLPCSKTESSYTKLCSRRPATSAPLGSLSKEYPKEVQNYRIVPRISYAII